MAWLRSAYGQRSAAAQLVLLGATLGAVLASLVVMILEEDPSAATRYQGLLVAAEAAVLAFFAADFVLGFVFAPSRRRYLFSIWTVLNLTSIAPGLLFLAHTDVSHPNGRIAFLSHLLAGPASRVASVSVRLLRLLRLVRVLQLAKVFFPSLSGSRATADAPSNSGLLVVEAMMIGYALVMLLLVPSPSFRTEIVGFGIGTIGCVALRYWLVRVGRTASAMLVLFGSLAAISWWVVSIDATTGYTRAVWFLLAAAMVACVSWLTLEAPEIEF